MQEFSASEAIQTLDKLIEEIPPGRVYYREPLPCSVDEQLGELCRRFVNAPEAQRGAFSSSLTRRQGDFLLVFSERMASLGIRESSLSRIRDGVTAIAMLSPTTIDMRESLLVLAVHRHSALKLQADPSAIMREAAKYATRETANQLEKLAQQQPVPIESMGFREGHSPEGFLYERTW